MNKKENMEVALFKKQLEDRLTYLLSGKHPQEPPVLSTKKLLLILLIFLLQVWVLWWSGIL